MNTLTTNAPSENQTKGGDSLRCYLSSMSNIKKLNLFYVDGCGLWQGPQAITHHWWFYGFEVLGFEFYFSPFKDQNPITCYIGHYRPPYSVALEVRWRSHSQDFWSNGLQPCVVLLNIQPKNEKFLAFACLAAVVICLFSMLFCVFGTLHPVWLILLSELLAAWFAQFMRLS